MRPTRRSALLSLLFTCWCSSLYVWGQVPGAAGAPATIPLYATRQSEFAIPFAVDRRVAQPIEVHLYVSVDRGRNWTLHSRQSPSASQFLFRASGDGEYWFASRTIDGARHAQSQPAPQPELRVVVDTVPPQIELTARPGEQGEVLTSWQLFDQNLAASSLKIEYQEGMGKPWKPVAIERPTDDVVRTSYQGQLTWWPETQSPTINIRAEVRDRAGNQSVANRRILLPALVPQQAPGGGLVNRAPNPFARQRQPSAGAVPWPSDNQRQNNLSRGTESIAQRSARVGNPPAANPPASAVSTRPLAPSPPGHLDPRIPTQQASTQLPAPPSGPAPGTSPATQRSLPNVSPVSVPVTPARDIGSMLPPGERPQMTNATRFHLDYDVDAVGPSGVAEVQLWATADAGHTWRMWGTDDDLESPFDVVVEEEGIFGFHVVVVGNNGMAGRRPRTGDPAGIWVGVDTTPPTAELTSATYGEGTDTGKLVIEWQAADRFLDARPVTLSFSESPDGPWTTIVSALPNDGRFAWPADPQLPSSVFLKLEVRDEAGNVATAQTKQPVHIDGLAPKARIRGVQPLHDLDREAFRLPRTSGTSYRE